MAQNYLPVSCQLHSSLELYAIRKQRIEITLKSDSQPLTGKIIDIYLKNRSEYLTLQRARKEGAGTVEIRLDYIDKISAIDA